MEDMLYYPARIVRSQLGQLFPSNDELLARYRERFPDSPVEQPYFLRTEISNNSLDHYFTHMLTSSLQNYAADAENGVGLQDGHDWRHLGYGRSLYGHYHSEPGIPPGWERLPWRGNGSEARPAIAPPEMYERVLSAAYVAPGLKFNANSYASTDDFIAAVESGTVEEVSIGYMGGSETCDICGARYFSWDCPHIAGFAYTVEREGEENNLLTTVSINNAHLGEYSAVYAGATPNALVVRKAEQEAEAGRLTQKQATVIEQRYRVRLAAFTRNWQGYNPTNINESEEQMSEENNEATVELEGQLRSILSETEAPESDSVIDGVRWLIAENAKLVSLAEQGQQYRSDLIEQALAEGVRAMGETFPSETYQRMFEGATIDHIKNVRDAWAKQAQSLFSKGRKTVDEEQTPASAPAGSIPKSAYKS